MRSTYQQSILLISVAIILTTTVTLTSGQKSIIRTLLNSPSQFGPDSNGVAHASDIPIENCRVRLNKELSRKLDRLCDECQQAYGRKNFHVQCRADCYNNDVFRGCAMAMVRQALVDEFTRFLDTEVKEKGSTLSTDEGAVKLPAEDGRTFIKLLTTEQTLTK